MEQGNRKTWRESSTNMDSKKGPFIFVKSLENECYSLKFEEKIKLLLTNEEV